ncbi:hypothetical protein D3C80_1885550 [compost metagenome]
MAFKENDIKFPQARKCLIVELQPLLSVKNRHRCRQMVECFSMALQRTFQLFTNGLGLGCVNRKTS